MLDARTLALRIERNDEDLQSSQGPEAHLSIVLNAARFAHSALLVMRHSRFGPANRELNEWLASYVHAEPDQAMPAELAKYPLASGKIEVMPAEGAAERMGGGLRVRLAFQYDPRPREAIELRLSRIQPPLAV